MIVSRVFIDADKKNYKAYLDYLISSEGDDGHCLLQDGALVVVDNTLWKGLVLDAVSEDTIFITIAISFVVLLLLLCECYIVHRRIRYRSGVCVCVLSAFIVVVYIVTDESNKNTLCFQMLRRHSPTTKRQNRQTVVKYLRASQQIAC